MKLLKEAEEKIDTFSHHDELVRAALNLYQELLVGRNVFEVKHEQSELDETETPELRGDQYN